MTAWGADHTNASNPGLVSAVLGSPSGSDWTIVSATPAQLMAGGATGSYLVRLPVTAGQTLGSSTLVSTEAAMCSTSNPADTGAYTSNPIGPGMSFTPTSIASYKAAI